MRGAMTGAAEFSRRRIGRACIALAWVCVLLGLLMGAPAMAQSSNSYRPLTVTGFNEDLIANGSGGSHRALATTSTRFDSDTSWKVMYSKDFVGDYGAAPYGLPNSGIITSVANTNIVYQLASYSASNSVLLRHSSDTTGGGATNGTLVIDAADQKPYAKLAILATSAEGSSTFIVTLNFSDGTSSNYPFNVPDWCSGTTPYAIKDIGRVTRTTDQFDPTYNPRLYDCYITLSSTDKVKTNTSIYLQFNSGNGPRSAIMAVTGMRTVSAPTMLTPTNETISAFDARWIASPEADRYRLDVSTGASFSTFVNAYSNRNVGNVTNVTVTNLSARTTYYCRVRGQNDGDTSADSNSTNTTTLTRLTVTSAYGTASPSGTNGYHDGTVVTSGVAGSPVDGGGGTQYLCSGWAMTGNDPLNGATTNFTMTVTNNASLTWLWTTNVIPGTITVTPTSLSFTSSYAGVSSQQNFCVSNSAGGPFGYTNLVTYGDGGSNWLAILPATGTLAAAQSRTHTGTVTVAGLNVGTYYATNAVSSATATNSPQYLAVALTVQKADQTITNFPNPGTQIMTNTVHLSAQASSGLSVTNFTVISGPATINDLTNLTFSASGSVSIAASQSGDTNWNSAPDVTNTFNVTKAVASVTLGGLTQTYDGTAKSATAITVPSGLTVNLTYDGATNQPVNVGTCAVTGTVVSALYSGQTNGAMTISAAQAAVYLTNLNQTYDGTAKHVAATTMPTGLTLTVTYNGGASAPSDAGSYAVTARVVDVNYSGLTNGILTISKQTQTVSFAAIPDQIATGTVALNATASSGLPVSFSVVSGPGQMVSASNLGFTGVGIVQVSASQTGDANWESTAVTNAVNVSHAMATVTLTNLSFTYNGSARSATATTVPAGLPVTITYSGSAVAPSNAGSYAVTGTVNHALYAGTNFATLTIAKATPTINFPQIHDQYVNRIVGLAATSDSGLPLTFSVVSGPASIDVAGTNLSFSNTGDVSVAAADAGDANWNSMAITNSFFVHNVLIWFTGTNGQLIANNGSPVRTKGTDFGGVGIGTVQTNVFTMGNEGTTNLVVDNWTTNGAGAAAFSVLSVATNVESRGISNIVMSFTPTNEQAFTAAVVFVHNGTTNAPFTFNIAGTGVQAAALGFNVTSVTFSTSYGVNPPDQSFVLTNIGQAWCAFTNVVNQGSGAWLTVTPSHGALDGQSSATLTAGASAAGLNVGIYDATVSVHSAVATNSPQSIPITLVVTQAVAEVSLGNLWQIYDGNARTVSVAILPEGLTCTVTYAGSSTAPTNAGSYAVTATVSEINYQGSTTGTLTVAQSNVVVNLGNLLQTYDGSAKTATVSTVPTGMTVAVTYNGSTAGPSNAGSYVVTAQVTEVNYQGSSVGTLTISKSSGMVYLDGLSHIYDGAVKSATATTMPSGLTVTFTYNGITNQPVNAGTYAVVGIINSSNYSGQANADLAIAMANQTIIFPSIGDQYWTNHVTLSATASSGLPVNFAVVSGPGQISGNTNLTFTEGGVVVISADQSGDMNWNAAETVCRSNNVYSPGIDGLGTNFAIITNNAPASLTNGTDFGSVPWGSVRTNVLALTNSGTSELSINGWVTNGAGQAWFSISGIPSLISAGGVSNISAVFSPAVTGIYSVALILSNNAPYSPFVLNLAGTGAKHDQTITNFMPTNGSVFIETNTVVLSAQASSGLPVTNFTWYPDLP